MHVGVACPQPFLLPLLPQLQLHFLTADGVACEWGDQQLLWRATWIFIDYDRAITTKLNQVFLEGEYADDQPTDFDRAKSDFDHHRMNANGVFMRLIRAADN